MRKLLTTLLIGLSSLLCIGQPLIVQEIGGSAIASLGSSVTISDATPISLRPTLPKQCTEYLWTTTGTGTFADSTAKNTTYTPSVNDLNLDSITLNLISTCDIGDSSIIYSHKLILVDYNYEFESVKLFSSLTTPLSDTAKIKVNNLIVMLKDSIGVDTLSEFFDRFYLLANETAEASVYDLCDSALSRRCTAVNSPTFTTFEGFTFNGTTNYLNTNYNPSSEGVNFTQNNCAVAAYSRTESIGKTSREVFTGSGSSTFIGIIPCYNNVLSFYLNTESGAYKTASNATSIGYYMTARNSSTIASQIGVKNFSDYATSAGSGATSAITDLDVYIGGRNMSNALNGPIDCQISVVFYSKYISTTLHPKILRCIEYYMDSNGKGVL